MEDIVRDRVVRSKVFASSRRKDAILSAMRDPMNSQLVSQMYTALDYEYRTKENLVKPEEPKVDDTDLMEESDTIEELSLKHI